MFAAMSPKSLQRAVDLADWAESQEATGESIWENPAFRRKFAGTSDAEFRLASSILRDRLATDQRADELRARMAEIAANVEAIRADMLGTALKVIEATTEWIASDPPALRGKTKGNAT